MKSTAASLTITKRWKQLKRPSVKRHGKKVPLAQLDILMSICDTWNYNRPSGPWGARTSQCTEDGRAGRGNELGCLMSLLSAELTSIGVTPHPAFLLSEILSVYLSH